MRIDTNQDGVTSVIVTARVKKNEGQRSPVCGKKCHVDMTREAEKCVNRGPLTCVAFFSLLRQKRSASYAASMVYSIQQSYGPMGRRFTKDFDRTTAWLAFPLPRKAVKEYLRIDWETEAEQIYSSSMTLAVSSSDSAFSRISSYEELSSRDAFNRISFI